jgi:hypothetical protein
VLELARLLRKAELCEALGVAEDGGLARGELAERLVATLSVEQVEAVVLEALRARKVAAGLLPPAGALSASVSRARRTAARGASARISSRVSPAWRPTGMR